MNLKTLSGETCSIWDLMTSAFDMIPMSIVLVDDREFLDAGAEYDAGRIVHARRVATHGGTSPALWVAGWAREVPCRDVAYHSFALSTTGKPSWCVFLSFATSRPSRGR